METFDSVNDTVMVQVGRLMLFPDEDFTVEGKVLKLKEGISTGKTVGIYIWKNVKELDEETAISGAMLADGSVDVGKISGKLPIQNGGWMIDGETSEQDKEEAKAALISLGLSEDGEVIDETAREDIDRISNEIVDMKANAIQQHPLYAESVEWLESNGDTTKVYVLPDGYIYGYIKKKVVVGGDYTNLANRMSADWLTGHRTSSSGPVADTGFETTNFLGDGVTTVGNKTIYYKDALVSNQRIIFYNANKEIVYNCYPSTFSNHTGFDGTATEGYLFIDQDKAEALSKTAVYVRLALNNGSSDPIITIDEEITDGEIVENFTWASTGHSFIPADYENQIVDIGETANRNSVNIVKLQEQAVETDERVTALELYKDSNVDELPAYWKEHLDGKISTIKSLQESGGFNSFSFIVITDIHYEQNLGKISPRLAKYIADECGIKYVLILGDCGTRNGILYDESYIDNEWANIENMLSPIRDRLLITDGNHDGSYGAIDGDGDGTVDDSHGPGNSAFNYSPQKKYNQIKRKVSLIPEVVFSEGGFGYYADDKNAKVRYIVLSTHNNKYEENTDGSSKYSNMNNFRYGQAQFDLVIKALTTLEDGWSVIVASHVPLDRSGELLHWGATEMSDNRLVSGEVECWLMADVLNAFINREKIVDKTFTGTQAGYDTVNVNADFTNANGTMIGYFGGHLHKDGEWGNTYTWDGRLKQCDFWTITSRSDARVENTSDLYNGRTKGTVTEHSFDVFTINTETRNINVTKIGAGSDRTITY